MRNKIILGLIIIIGIILRFNSLGQVPTSLDWDEASIGYNAYSILKTGRDEYGEFLPLQIRSFGDYKPPLYVYLSIIPIMFFGLSEFAVRLPSAVFGVIALIFTYKLLAELVPKNSKLKLLAVLLLSISPWHIQFSRVAFEANIALCLFIIGIYYFVRAAENGKYLFLSALSFALGIYSYHSLRLVVPIMVISLLLTYRSSMLKMKSYLITSGIFASVLLLPLLILASGTGARFSSVTVINPETISESIPYLQADIERNDQLGRLLHNRRVIYTLEVLKGYFSHWNIDFLFIQGDGPGRHHAPDMGMLYLIELPLVLIGIYTLLFSRSGTKLKTLILIWFFVAPISSALTTGTPHAVRALLYLPTFQIFTALGLLSVLKIIPANIYKITASMIVLTYIVSIHYYLDMYYVHGPIEQAHEWQYGYREMVNEVSKISKNYHKVIVTYRYDQPYVYFLFYEKIDPLWYQNEWTQYQINRTTRQFGNLVFKNIDWENDSKEENTLFVGTPNEVPNSAKIIKEIKYPNGSIVFRIAES